MRFRKFFIPPFLMLLVVNSAVAELTITVQPNRSWGDITTTEIKALCYNVVSHFQDSLRDSHKIDGILNVYYANDGPFIRHNPPNRHNIAISALGTHLNQFTYQFSHELCHVIHNYEDTTVDNPNLWFQESMCMMASIWVLKDMYRTWKDNPPYTHWKNYREFLLSYANSNMERQGVQYSGTSEQWLTEWEDFLRSDYKNPFTHHLLVSQLSYNFLPIFEENPEAWNAVRQMPSSKGKIKDYMRDWYDIVDTEDQRFVQAIAEEMGIDVLSPTPDVVTAMDGALPLTLTYQFPDALTPINGIDEWDGWTAGVWEKYPDGTTTRMPGAYQIFSGSDTWNHWIYAHAPSILKYDISGVEPTRFGAYFGAVHSGCVPPGATMQIFARSDGLQIYKSKVLVPDDYGIYIEFAIPEGAQVLEIEVHEVEWTGCDHYVFGEPKLFLTSIETDSADTTIVDADVNNDGSIDIEDVKLVRKGMTENVPYDTDINDDGVTDEVDLLIVKAKAIEAIVAASPQKRKVNITTWGALKRR